MLITPPGEITLESLIESRLCPLKRQVKSAKAPGCNRAEWASLACRAAPLPRPTSAGNRPPAHNPRCPSGAGEDRRRQGGRLVSAVATARAGLRNAIRECGSQPRRFQLRAINAGFEWLDDLPAAGVILSGATMSARSNVAYSRAMQKTAIPTKASLVEDESITTQVPTYAGAGTCGRTDNNM